jgi:hypothetical protein
MAWGDDYAPIPAAPTVGASITGPRYEVCTALCAVCGRIVAPTRLDPDGCPNGLGGHSASLAQAGASSGRSVIDADSPRRAEPIGEPATLVGDEKTIQVCGRAERT